MIYLKGTVVKIISNSLEYCKTTNNTSANFFVDSKDFRKYIGKTLVIEEVLDRGLYYRMSYLGDTINKLVPGSFIKEEASIGDLLTEHLVIQLDNKDKYYLMNINGKLCAVNYQDHVDKIDSIIPNIVRISKINTPENFYNIFYTKDESCLKKIWEKNDGILEMTKEELSGLLGVKPDKIIIK